MGVSLIYHVVLVSGVQHSVILQLFPIFVLFFRPMVSVCWVLLTHFMDVTVVFFSPYLWTRVIIIGAHHLFLNLLRIMYI